MISNSFNHFSVYFIFFDCLYSFQELRHTVKVQTVDNAKNTFPSSNQVLEDKRGKGEMPTRKVPPARLKKIITDRASLLPSYCGRKGAMCQPVDSRLLPNNKKR